MPGDGNGLFRQSENTSTLVFYAADPLQQITVNSVENIYPPFDLSRPGECVRFNPTPVSAGLVATFDLSTLGLVPPFRLQF